MALTASQMESLLISRIEKRYAEGKIPGIHRIESLQIDLTPEEMLYHIRHGTPVGEEILQAEKQYMEELQHPRRR